MQNLFTGINIKGNQIKNRVVMPPMVCFGWSNDEGFVTEDHISHYEKRAKGGTGLIIVEATCVNKDGRLANPQLGIWSDEHIEGLRKIADACHKHGAKVLIQIHHAGLQSPDNVAELPVAPSDYEKDGELAARALTSDEIAGIQENFLSAAKRAEKAGFDGIELHGAHGYLIDQFMSTIINKRDDTYGGSFENRARFALEIVHKIKEQAGENFIIGYRMGGNTPNLEEGIRLAQSLEKNGVDLLHVSAGIRGGDLPKTPEDFPYNWIVFIGTEVKKHVSIPVITVNDIRTPDRASYLVENGLVDLVAIGRGHLVDAFWAEKAENNEDVISCLKCPKCSLFKDGKLCPRNRQKVS